MPLTVTPANRNVSAIAGTTGFMVYSIANWWVVSDADWCLVTPSGTGNDSIIASYAENLLTSSRIAHVSVFNAADGSDSVKVTVTQARSTIGI